MFTLSPTRPLRLTFIFSSKSIVVVLRLRTGSDGLSMLFIVAPNFSSAVPCVLMRTPPGPNIFSAGPRSKCISVKSNFSLPLAWYISSFFLRKNWFIMRRSLHLRYSSCVIINGALMYESDIFEPMM